MAEAQKRGSRNSKEDRERIRGIRSMARGIHDMTMEMEPEDMDAPEEMDMTEHPQAAKTAAVIDFGEAVIWELAVKAAGDWALDILGVPFGSPSDKDAQKQYFSPKTELYLKPGEETPVFYYHGLQPDGKPQPKPELIGYAKHDRTDERGHWFKVLLDKASEFARRVWDAAQAGKARASSGSLLHLVRIASDGEILAWPFGELSVFDTNDRRQPSNKNAVVSVAKAKFTPVIQQPEATGEADRPGAADNQNQNNGEFEMDENKVQELIVAALKADRDAREAEAKAEAEKQAAIDAAVKAEKEKWEAEAAKSRRLPSREAPYVTRFGAIKRFDNVDAADLGLAIDILKGANKPVSQEAMRALAIKTMTDKPDQATQEMGFALKAAGFTATKADEVMQQDLTGYGDEWVGVGYGTRIWESIRQGTNVLAKVPSFEIPQGYETFYDPLEGADPTWYKVAETTDENTTTKIPNATVTSSKVATARQNETLAKGGARVQWTGELNEDSLIAMAPEVRRKLEISGSEMLEMVLIDGDTATDATTNINDIGGTPAGTESFLLANGFRKLALVTNTANSRSAAGNFVVADFVETLKLMGAAGINALDMSKTGFIVDANVSWKALDLAEVKTRDVFANPTIEAGVLTRIYNRDVMVSAFMHNGSAVRKANSAGKVDLDTTANNAYGAILAVRWDQWKFGWKRRMTIETTRIPRYDAWEVVALCRFGLKYRDNEASAITYYVGV